MRIEELSKEEQEKVNELIEKCIFTKGKIIHFLNQSDFKWYEINISERTIKKVER